jgi:hypothetical protein
MDRGEEELTVSLVCLTLVAERHGGFDRPTTSSIIKRVARHGGRDFLPTPGDAGANSGNSTS